MIISDILNERVVDVDATRFHRNPSRAQIIGLAAKMDLRGTSDGTNVYVWDANVRIHLNAKWDLRFDGDFYDAKQRPDGTVYFVQKNVTTLYDFYVNRLNVRARRGKKENWINLNHTFLYQLDDQTRLGVKKPNGLILEDVPAFKAIVRGCPRSD